VPLDAPSPKAERVRSQLLGATADRSSLWPSLPRVLVDHTRPQGAAEATFEDDERSPRPAATLAACVHTDGYGTRSAALVRIPEAEEDLPEMMVADGAPCTVPFVDVSDRWAD
jgi:hypothetical protein